MAVFWKSCLYDWPLAGIWEFGFWESSNHYLIKMALCVFWTNNIVFILNTCFPFGSLEFVYLPGRGCIYDQSSCKTLGIKFHALSWLVKFHVLSQLIAGRIKHILRLHWEKSLGSLFLLVSLKVCMFLFSLLILLCMFFCNNHSCEENYILSTVSTLSYSSNLGVGLADLFLNDYF